MRNSSFPKKQAVNVLLPENNLDNNFPSILKKNFILLHIQILQKNDPKTEPCSPNKEFFPGGLNFVKHT